MTDTTYPVDPTVVQKVGPVPALVLAILSDARDLGGTSMTHAEVASRAGIPHISARRAVIKLREAGLLKSEAQYRHNRQRANLYRVLTDGQFVPPAHIEQANISITQSLVLKREIEGVEELPAVPEASGALTGTEVSLTSQEDSRLRRGQEEGGKRYWTPPGTPMPKRPARPNIWSSAREASWLVMFFGGCIREQINQERQRLGRPPLGEVAELRRLESWYTSAEASLVRTNPPTLEEICQTITWVFTQSDGYLPFEVANEFSPTGTAKAQDRKLTRLKQVFDHYDRIRASMATDKTVHRQDIVNQGQQCSSAVVDLDAKVAELVQLFAEFRDMPPDDLRRNNHATTFRIMLDKDRISFDDIKLVVTSLRIEEVRMRVDTNRYQDAYWLRQEFHDVYGLVTTTLASLASRTPPQRPEPEPLVTPEQMRSIGCSEDFIADQMARRHSAARSAMSSDDDDDGESPWQRQETTDWPNDGATVTTSSLSKHSFPSSSTNGSPGGGRNISPTTASSEPWQQFARLASLS